MKCEVKNLEDKKVGDIELSTEVSVCLTVLISLRVW